MSCPTAGLRRIRRLGEHRQHDFLLDRVELRLELGGRQPWACRVHQVMRQMLGRAVAQGRGLGNQRDAVRFIRLDARAGDVAEQVKIVVA